MPTPENSYAGSGAWDEEPDGPDLPQLCVLDNGNGSQVYALYDDEMHKHHRIAPERCINLEECR